MNRFQRVFFAIILLFAPLALAGWFGLCPQYGNPACPDNMHTLAAMAAFRVANPLLQKIFFSITLIIPYIYPISYVCLGMLAMKRSPWFATLGIVCGWLGSIAWGFISDSMFHLDTAVRLGQEASFSVLYSWHGFFAEPYILLVGIGWVIGHLLAYIFLGIAVLRARVLPWWAGWLLIVSAPLMGPVAYGTQIGIFQVLGFLLVFIASIPAALVIVHKKA